MDFAGFDNVEAILDLSNYSRKHLSMVETAGINGEDLAFDK